MSKITFFIALQLLTFFSAVAQTESQNLQAPNHFSVLFGLNQPILLKGFNVELNYWTKKWVIDYSHGFGLHADGKSLGDDYENQKINFKITHSAGIGVGYRFTKAFNIRFEPKIHVYETYYEGARQTHSNSIANFTTYTLGVGAYYLWMPFGHKQNALKGITIVPSVRYWQKVGSTLDGDAHSYFNTQTNQIERFKAPNIGLANTPIVLNVSVGYTF
jgi:hypothetical protein